MPLPEDTILENRYRIDGLLAYGGMSAVYHAQDTNLQVKVAIKENYFRTPEAIEQFRREALMLARLRHPALPRVLQHFSHEGQQYLAMEFIEGPNLWELIKETGQPLSEAQALAWIDRICDAVTYLHNCSPAIVHRDIKPQNIKVMPSGQVVLVDFGVAKEGGVDDRTATGARGVTPGFSPPEQYSGSGSSPASDVYALGATLYALLTGVKPPDSVSLAIGEAQYVPPDKLNAAISPEVGAAITWAMQPRPANRPQTVAAWQDTLRSIRSRAAPPPKPAAPPPAEIAPSEQPPWSPSSPRAAPLPPEPVAEKRAKRTEAAASESEEPTCASCGTENRAGVRFCENCGRPLNVPQAFEAQAPRKERLPPPPNCRSCGAALRSGLSFCEECGTAL